MKRSTFLLVLLAASVHAWLPQDRDLAAFNRTYNAHAKRVAALPSKIRGVNLGGWLVSEPWLMKKEWTQVIGCPDCSDCNNGGKCSEFDCVSAIGQSAADAGFNKHYAGWITPADIQKIHDAGLNTVRIPIGYWSLRALVDSSEHFPTMDLQYLDAVIQKAADLGMFVVMDLHAAPGAQKTNDAFTGQCLPPAWLPGFFTQRNYDRASRWLSWMTQRIHNTPSYKQTVGIIEVVNEPQSSREGMPPEEVNTFTQVYYPQALKAVRDAEAALNVPAGERLHVQFMDNLWGSGDPKSHLPSDAAVLFDDHNYVGGAVEASSHPGRPQDVRQADYMWYTCYTDNRLSDGDTPKVVQEFSLTVDGAVEGNGEFAWAASQNQAFYAQWWNAQQRLYEQTNGWIFWTWKVGDELNNPRWSYQRAVAQGWIPGSAAGLDGTRGNDVCKKYFGTSDGRG
ncbi:glycoside hydrolase family 5 protein [Karstenula rhodostoma CBS 690.94]|uniref:glucan endo-1,6-beta-glucosidase n=1 Tax=Karstenula rhodostoma CBS 690.94 TaxID=1392251 RepID=A0A9P4PJW5_9PLEO|nr:glycoside hydrolase family 5 protein [Karstenula rhodostoma CBS 690.94]